MGVTKAGRQVRVTLAQLCAAVMAAGTTVSAGAQLAQNDLPPAPSAVVRPLVLAGGVMVDQAKPGAVSLTLDQAIQMALTGNTEIKLRSQQERFVYGQQLSTLTALLPNLRATGYVKAQEIDLVALGFKPGSIKIPGVNTANIASIVKVNTASAQMTLSQQLFNAPAFFLYRATRAGRRTRRTGRTLNARGGVVLQVGALYLQALADDAAVRNAEGLVKQDELVYEHAKASRDAGVGINLDVLRAEVELKNEQQQLERARNAAAKDRINLNRAMGQNAGQELELVDAVPYSDYDADSSDAAIQAALGVAYERRKDLPAVGGAACHRA